MTGEVFASFICKYFNLFFAKPTLKADGQCLFVMGNDPSLTSRAAKLALEDMEGSFHEIPPRSPDNRKYFPIENIVHLVKNRRITAILTSKGKGIKY